MPTVNADAVLADRIVGKPYLEIDINRAAIARYGINIQTVQHVIEVALGGKPVTQTIEGRERYPVRVRYQREMRDSIESIEKILVAAPDGTQIPLKELSTINTVRGPQVIKSEDTFLVGYVIFDKAPGYSEVDVVEQANRFLKDKQASGELVIPAGVSYRFTGTYENQVRAQQKLRLILPVALAWAALQSEQLRRLHRHAPSHVMDRRVLRPGDCPRRGEGGKDAAHPPQAANHVPRRGHFQVRVAAQVRGRHEA